jgi:hypothetical protein
MTRGAEAKQLSRLRSAPKSTEPWDYPAADSPSSVAPPSESHVDSATSVSSLALRRTPARSLSRTASGESSWDAPPISAWQPITRASVMCVKTASLSAWVPNRGTPEPAIVHGFARGLLVFKLPDQLTFRFTQGTGDIRVLSDRYQRR